MTPSIDALSNELLLEIISHIQSNRDIAAFSRQCRRFHNLCDLDTRRKYRRIRLHTNSQLNKAFSLLIAILRKPQLGMYLRHMDLDWQRRGRYRLERTLSSDDMDRLRQAILNAGFIPDKETDFVFRLLTEINETAWLNTRFQRLGLPQAVAALLISVAPQLESLGICPLGMDHFKIARQEEFGIELRLLKRFLQRSLARIDQIPYLHRLRNVRFLPNFALADSRFYEMYDVNGSLNLVRRLPGIETVHFDAIMECHDNNGVRPPPRSANYSKIILNHCMMDSHVDIIASAKKLREYTWSSGSRASPDATCKPLEPDDFFKSLLRHCDTLERLDLNIEHETVLRSPMQCLFDETCETPMSDQFYVQRQPDAWAEEAYQYEWADELKELQTAPSDEAGFHTLPASLLLRSLHRLKHLGLGIYLLMYYARGIKADKNRADLESFSLVNHLPPNLESLRIYGYQKGMKPVSGMPDLDLDAHIATLMEEKAEKLPHLTLVEGVDVFIPNDAEVQNPDENFDLYWQPDLGEWTDYEYDA